MVVSSGAVSALDLFFIATFSVEAVDRRFPVVLFVFQSSVSDFVRTLAALLFGSKSESKTGLRFD